MEKLRVAIIGQGRSGLNIHGKFFLSDSNKVVEVVAVVDRLEARREKAKKLFNCEVYTDYKELFARKDIDLVVNATYSQMHAPITKDLLLHGYQSLLSLMGKSALLLLRQCMLNCSSRYRLKKAADLALRRQKLLQYSGLFLL